MKKYEIYFGKEPEDLEFGPYWPDKFPGIESEYVSHKKIVSNNKKTFLNKYIKLINDPIAMWYWVLINGVQVMSGAISPDDFEIVRSYLK